MLDSSSVLADFKKQSISPHKHNILLLFEEVNSLCLCLFLLFIFYFFIKLLSQTLILQPDWLLRDKHSSYLLNDLLLQGMLTSQTMVQR